MSHSLAANHQRFRAFPCGHGESVRHGLRHGSVSSPPTMTWFLLRKHDWRICRDLGNTEKVCRPSPIWLCRRRRSAKIAACLIASRDTPYLRRSAPICTSEIKRVRLDARCSAISAMSFMMIPIGGPIGRDTILLLSPPHRQLPLEKLNSLHQAIVVQLLGSPFAA